jgi:pseudouridine synthase
MLKENNVFSLTFTPTSGETVEQTFNVERVAGIQAQDLHVTPDGKAGGLGTKASPMDLATAISLLPPGGKITLAAGDYPRSEIPLAASGSADNVKTLEAEGKAVLHGLLVDASYWHIKGIDVTEKSLRIQGSHNLIEGVTAYRNDDTGIQISSPEKMGRPLWASYNRVINAESYANEDPGKINADGFAVKMRVGEGNRLENCYSHDNIDDGFDLFNKIEDGANGVVVIENSIARNNTSNGFKLGGEGQPVAHEVRNSKAVGNHLDIDTTGLVLMTDDGQWSHRITSPRHHCEKTYRVMLESPVSDSTAQQFADGVQLHNEKDLTRPAVLEVITPTEVRLTISEGRYHQVKRMFAAVGNRVVGLHRERIGAIALDDDLEPGEYRPLTAEEIASVGLPSR